MKCLLKIVPFFIFLFSGLSIISAQDSGMDPYTRHLLDSLDNRIKTLTNEVSQSSASHSASYFFKRRELDMTIFQKNYYMDIYNEELDRAQRLIDSRLSAAEKRGDHTEIKFYHTFKTKLTRERSNQLARYQKLFAKEKTFRKELYSFLDKGDEYSLKRAQRMTDLAMKFAKQKHLETVIKYLNKYEGLVKARLYDFYSDYDLEELTKSKKSFQKVFAPMIASDSLDLLKKAGELVENCYNYAASSNSALDTDYFALQRKVVLSSISDYNERKGYRQAMANIKNTTIIARLDTLNQIGVYKWHDHVVVVGSFRPSSGSVEVQKGEAIIDADHRLIEYIRVNNLAKIGEDVKMGYTFLIPFKVNGSRSDFRFNPEKKSYQYIACYAFIKSTNFTKSVSKFFPVMEFESEVQ